MITLRALPTRATHERFDWSGNVLLFFALGGFILALSEGGTLGWSDPIVIGGLAAFVIMTPLFLWVEWRSSSPLMNLRLFGNRRYASAYVATFLNAFARTAVVLLIGLYEQTIHHTSAFVAGLAVLPVTIGMIVVSPVAGSLASRYDARILSSLGLAVSGLGIAILTPFTGMFETYVWEGIGMLLVGGGSALFMTPNTSSIMLTIDPAHRGTANGLRSMLQNMGQVTSTALSLMLVAVGLPKRLQSLVYQGNSAQIPGSDLPWLISGFRMAMVSLLVATVLGVVVSLVRGPKSV